MAQLALARALLAESHASGEVDRCLDAAQARVEATGGRALAPQILEERARLAGLRGDAGSALDMLRQAQAAYVAIGADAHARRLSDELTAPASPVQEERA